MFWSKYKFEHVFIIVLTCISIALIPGKAYAVMPVVDGPLAALVGVTNTVLGTIQGTLLSGIERILLAMDASAGKVSQAIAESHSNAITQLLESDKEKAIQHIEEQVKMPIDPCANAGRGLGNPDFDQLRPGVSGAGFLASRGSSSGGRVDTGSSKLNQSIRIAEGREKSPTPESQAILAAAGACEVYASDVRREACLLSGLATGSPRFPNADVLSNTLFYGAQSADQASKISLTFGPEQLAAAKAFVRNLFNSMDLPALTRAQASTDAGRRLMGMRDNYLARVDLAQRPSHELQVNMHPNVETIPMLKAMIAGSASAASYIQKNLDRTWPNWRNTGISNRHFEYLEASRRYANADWFVDVSRQTNQASLLREQLMIGAQTNYLLDKLLTEIRYNNVLQGNIYMATVNRDLQPDLVAAYRQASSGR